MQRSIAIIPGDYIGPEITKQAVKVLQAVGARYGHDFALTTVPASGEAWDKYGEYLPESTIETCRTSDAILKGPFGGPTDEVAHPKWKNIERGAIFPLRKLFNFHTNLRPVKVHDFLENDSPLKPEYIRGVDIMFVRELVSGIYFGEKGRSGENGDAAAFDVEWYTDKEIRQVTHRAFQLARGRRSKVTLVGKSNVMESSVFWREVVGEIAPGYADVELDYMHVDNASMQIILDPRQFDVVLTSNLFGDILTDEASVLVGSIGMLASVSQGDGSLGLYEPIHGSAPTIAGRDIANPVSQVMCVSYMLRWSLSMPAEADAVEAAVCDFYRAGLRPMDYRGDAFRKLGTEAVGDWLANRVAQA